MKSSGQGIIPFAIKTAGILYPKSPASMAASKTYLLAAKSLPVTSATALQLISMADTTKGK